MYVKIIAFSEIVAGDMFFCLWASFVFVCLCMCLPVLKRRKNLYNRNSEKKKLKKSRIQNVQTETAKNSGNGDILVTLRQLLLFRISSDNFA